MSSLVEAFLEFDHVSSPLNVRLLVKVPKTYQNIFSIWPGFSIKYRIDSESEYANGMMAMR